jgi:hypothetical protein
MFVRIFFMKLQELHILDDVLEVYPSNIGKLYLFDDLVILEVFEGVHVTHQKLKSVVAKINSFYGDQKIGFISNRINKYSIEAIEYPKFANALPNIAIFTVCYYNLKAAYNLELEKRFLKNPIPSFTKLLDAYNFTKSYILKKAN